MLSGAVMPAWLARATAENAGTVPQDLGVAHQQQASLPGAEPGRNHARKPGHAFRDILDLPGWEEQSVWGYDEGLRSFFAQLWRNGSHSDAPEIWLTGAQRPYPWPGCVALGVFEATGHDPATEAHALGITNPAAHLRPVQEVAGKVDQLASHAGDPYVDGQRDALLWVLGQANVRPGSGWQWSRGVPTTEEVVAEHHLVTGHVYGPEGNRSIWTGADEALFWALGH